MGSVILFATPRFSIDPLLHLKVTVRVRVRVVGSGLGAMPRAFAGLAPPLGPNTVLKDGAHFPVWSRREAPLHLGQSHRRAETTSGSPG